MSAKVEQADADRNETEVETPVDKYEMHKGENGVNFIDRVPMGETVEAMLASLDTEYTDVTIKDKNGNDVTTGKVGTGMKVRLNFVNKPDVDVVEYEIVIWGDLTGDGEMTSEDFVNWRRNDLAESTILSHAELRAADFNNDGVLDSADAVEMRRADIL